MTGNRNVSHTTNSKGHSKGHNTPLTTQSYLSAPPDLSEEHEDMDSYASSNADDGERDWQSDEENTTKSAKSSFADKVAILQTVLPDSVGTASSSKSILTEADKIFGNSLDDKETVVLLESAAVQAELKKVQASARDSITGEEELNLGPKEVPDFPRALPCGKFLKSRPPPFPKRGAIKHVVIPEATLGVSAEDLLLSKGKGQRNVVIPDKAFHSWEETARRGLESISVMDSFFGGTLKSIFRSGPNGIEVNQELGTQEIQHLVSQVSNNLLFAAHAMATLHTNIIMARREAILSDSAIPAEKRASLRALPPGKTLFDEHVHSVIKSHAELMRDLSFQAPKAPKRPAPARAPHESSQGPPRKKQQFSKVQKSQRGARSGSGSHAKSQAKPKSTPGKNQNF